MYQLFGGISLFLAIRTEVDIYPQALLRSLLVRMLCPASLSLSKIFITTSHCKLKISSIWLLQHVCHRTIFSICFGPDQNKTTCVLVLSNKLPEHPLVDFKSVKVRKPEGTLVMVKRKFTNTSSEATKVVVGNGSATQHDQRTSPISDKMETPVVTPGNVASECRPATLLVEEKTPASVKSEILERPSGECAQRTNANIRTEETNIRR